MTQARQKEETPMRIRYWSEVILNRLAYQNGYGQDDIPGTQRLKGEMKRARRLKNMAPATTTTGVSRAPAISLRLIRPRTHQVCI